VDEGVRRDIERLASLKPVLKADGVVTGAVTDHRRRWQAVTARRPPAVGLPRARFHSFALGARSQLMLTS
jgi:hypothetical protein